VPEDGKSKLGYTDDGRFMLDSSPSAMVVVGVFFRG